MEISWIISSTSSSAFSTSIILMATAWPVRRSTLENAMSKSHPGWRRQSVATLCTPFQSCHHLSHVRNLAAGTELWNRPMQFCLEYSVSGSTLPPPARTSAAAIAEQLAWILVDLFPRLCGRSVLYPKLFQMIVAGSTSAPFLDLPVAY